MSLQQPAKPPPITEPNGFHSTRFEIGPCAAIIVKRISRCFLPLVRTNEGLSLICSTRSLTETGCSYGRENASRLERDFP
jgi:hypothetical protein